MFAPYVQLEGGSLFRESISSSLSVFEDPFPRLPFFLCTSGQIFILPLDFEPKILDQIAPRLNIFRTLNH
jgi:hypothetical protein